MKHTRMFVFLNGKSDLSLSATFHWPFSRDGQLVAIISYASDLSLAFSLILQVCNLLVGLLFHVLDPCNKFCCDLSWIFDFSLMFILPPHVSFSPLIHAMLNCPPSLLLPFFLSFFPPFFYEDFICLQAVLFPPVIWSFHLKKKKKKRGGGFLVVFPLSIRPSLVLRFLSFFLFFPLFFFLTVKVSFYFIMQSL